MQTPEGSHASVAALYRYPVKGLTPEPLPSVELRPGQTVPFDRAYAIENGPGRFDPEAPKHLPKITFLMLMRDERLATLRSTFDDATQTLTISRGGKPVVSGRLDTPLGRQLIEQFMAAYMKAELRGAPKVVSSPGHSFSDMAAKCVSIINLASVRELERAVGRPVDPLRFRANVYVEGLAPWAELQWLDQAISIGPVRLDVFARIRRCDATNVDPTTAARDMAVPATLMRTWGHQDLGMYAKVVEGGTISVGSEVVHS
jgi:MOSC domain-containing protein